MLSCCRAFLQSYHVHSCPTLGLQGSSQQWHYVAFSPVLHCKTRFLHTGSLGTNWNNFGTQIMLHVQTWCTREASYRDSRGCLESVRPVGDRLPGTTHEPRSTRRAKKSSVAKECQRSDDQIAHIENSWASWYFMNHHDTSWLSGFSWHSVIMWADSQFSDVHPRSLHLSCRSVAAWSSRSQVMCPTCPGRRRSLRVTYQVTTRDFHNWNELDIS